VLKMDPFLPWCRVAKRNLSRAFRAAALSGFLRTDGKTYALKDGSRHSGAAA